MTEVSCLISKRIPVFPQLPRFTETVNHLPKAGVIHPSSNRMVPKGAPWEANECYQLALSIFLQFHLSPYSWEHLRSEWKEKEYKLVVSCQGCSLSLFHRQKAGCHNKQCLFHSHLWFRAGEGEVSLTVIVEHINNNGSLQIIDQSKQRELAVKKARK